jgi:hypothetical protein
MDDTLDKRLRAIVGAGWRAALIGACVYMAAWVLYLVVMHARPAWLLDLWGGALDWPTVQTVSLCFFGALKALWFVFLFGVLFVALLRHQLKRLG